MPQVGRQSGMQRGSPSVPGHIQSVGGAWLGSSLSQELLEINSTVDSHVLNSGHLHLGFSGQALLPSVFMLAAGLCPSLAPHLFCCGYFPLAPITLRLTPKQTSPGVWRYLAGSDRLVPQPGPRADKGPAVSLRWSLGLQNVTWFFLTINHWGASSIN